MRAGFSSAVKQWTADEDELVKEGKRQKLSFSQIAEGLTGRTVKAVKNRYERKLKEHASVPAATPVSVRTAAPAASSATRVNRPRRRPPTTATPTGRQAAARLAASSPSSSPRSRDQTPASTSDSDSDDGGGPSSPPPNSSGGQHVSAQAAAFEDSRQRRADGRADAAEQSAAVQRAAEQRVAEQRAAERTARDAEMPTIDLLGQNNEMASFVQEGGGTLDDGPPAYRSLSAAPTVGPSDDQEDGDDDDVSMAGSEAINDEEDPGYATSAYGADAEDMEE